MSLPGFSAEAVLQDGAHVGRGVSYRSVGAHWNASSGICAQALLGPGGPSFIGHCTPYCIPCQPGDTWHSCIDSSCRSYQRLCIIGGGGGGGGLVPGDGTGGTTISQ